MFLVPGDRPPRGGHGPCCLPQHGANDVEMLGMTERRKKKNKKEEPLGQKKMIKKKRQLDDGWPESVEEQGLLLLVCRRNFRNDL